MFWNEELEVLRLRKAVLTCQCDVHRELLLTEWQRLHSPQFWVEAAGQAASRHPLGALGVAGAAGVLLTRVLRRPGSVLTWTGRLGGMLSTGLSLLGLFKQNDSKD